MAEMREPGDREILDRAAEILQQAGGGDQGTGAARMSLNWPATERLAGSLDWGQARIGDMPPQPPTLRARFSAALVWLVRRSLFWYSDQILAFQKLVASAAAEQARTFEKMAARTRAGEQAAAAAVNARIAALEQRLGGGAGLESQADGFSQAIARLNAAFGGLAAGAQRRDEAIEELRAHAQRSEQELVESRLDLTTKLKRVDRLAHESKQFALQQGLRLRVVLNELRGSAHAPDVITEPPPGPEDQWPELTRAHADVFRGTPADIRERLRVYLPYARRAMECTGQAPVLDLGCGRGEWLELMHEEDFSAKGVDASLDMVLTCRQAGLDVEHANLLSYLRQERDESRSLVTAFHVVEHLPWDDLLELIDHAVRVLKPGGKVIFETPNARNLQVASYTFHLDPSHIRPLPSELLSFLVEARGLCEPETLSLHPYPDSFHLDGGDRSAAASFINQVFFGPQDYAIIANKV